MAPKLISCMMTTKRSQEKLQGWQICACTGAPGLLSALQDDTEEETFFSIFCDSIYCIFKKRKNKTNKQKKNNNKKNKKTSQLNCTHLVHILLFVSKLHPILNPMRTGHELKRSMIVFFGNLIVCFCVLLKTYEIYSYKRHDSISYKMLGNQH